MNAQSDILERLLGHLHAISGAHARGLAVTPDSEIYYDLDIYGDEFVELVWWIEKEFEVESRVNISDYAPSERPLPFFYGWMQRRDAKKNRYKNLKVRDVVAVIEAGHWPQVSA